MKKQIIIGFNDTKLTAYVWDKVTNPVGIVQIIHGMQEHITRYNNFAKFLNSNGYIVFGNDLRGHGETCGDVNNLGHTHSDIFGEIVEDEIIISNYLCNKYKLPLFVIGHSYGSFITQRYIQNCNLATKVVLCGTAYVKTPLMRFAKFVNNVITLFKGYDSPATLIENLSFGKYAKKFNNGNWLTRDEKIFLEYKNDKYCGTRFTNGFYKSSFKNFIANYKHLNSIQKDIQILIVCGNADPVGGYGKLSTKLEKVYIKNGINAKLNLYEGGRHEILNETNREEVYNDVLEFLKK